MDYRIFNPLLQFMGDFSLAMLKDDQRDLAFPTRAHGGFHHFHGGLMLFPLAKIAMELIDVYEIIKTEKFMANDTPASFLQRAIAIHNKTYVRPTDTESQDRVAMLHAYLDQLRGERTKKSIERRLENAIYMGKIKTKGQLDQEYKRYERIRHPPKIKRRRASQGKIMLYHGPE